MTEIVKQSKPEKSNRKSGKAAYVSESDLQITISNLKRKTALRNEAVLLVSHFMGLRAKEMAALKIGDLYDFRNGILKDTIRLLAGDVSEQIKKIGADYDEVVIDAGGFDNTEYRQAISVADVILIPLLVGSSANIEGLQKVAETIEKIRADNLPKVYGVVTKAPHFGTSPELERAINEIISDPLTEPCPTTIGDRVWYTRAFDDGIGILDLQPLKRSEAKYIKSAQDEFLTLFNFIYGENNV